MSRILIGLYTLLLHCYPPAHRREYGGWMKQLFADQLRTAQRQKAVPSLLLRTIWDALKSIPAEHIAALLNRGSIGVEWMKPVAWKHVLFALLPGLFMVASAYFPSSNDPWIVVPMVGLSLVVIAVSPIAHRRLTEWALPTLGLLTATVPLLIWQAISWRGGGLPPTWWRVVNTGVALLMFAVPALLLLGLIVQRQLTGHNLRRTWRVFAAILVASLVFAVAEVLIIDGSPWPATPMVGPLSMALSAPFVMLGLPLARRHGMRAGLYVVSGVSLLTVALIDPDYGLWETIWGNALPALMMAGYVVIAPLLMMRAAQKDGKVRGMLLPVGVVLLLGAIIPAVIRDYGPITVVYRLAWVVQPCLALLLAITLYDELHGEADAQAAPVADVPIADKVVSSNQPGEEHAFTPFTDIITQTPVS
jgi:uncharacterized membrane protein YgdD (TMEM256/DUF423 family)